MASLTSRVTRSSSRQVAGHPEHGSCNLVRHEIDSGSGSDSEQSEPPRKKVKRARKSGTKGREFKHSRRKQGALEAITKMPIEIFTEASSIAGNLNPVDLISLVRTNKSLRSLLLRRSAVRVWQRAEANVPGLPPCPTGMSEPQYAALLFCKYCTTCGAGAMSKPDAWLRLRLCVRCRDTRLGSAWEVISHDWDSLNYVSTSADITLANPRYGGFMGRRFILDDLAKVKQIKQDYLIRGDYGGLEGWQREKSRQLAIRYQEGKELSYYIEAVETSRALQLEALKASRLQLVHEKLEALGWEEKYLDFTDSTDSRKWYSLVEVPKPLTERMWKNLLPKITPLLDNNRIQVDEYEKQLRKDARCEKICELMNQLNDDTYPYHAITQALNIEPPGNTIEHLDGARDLVNPFPSFPAISGWNAISGIYNEEHSLETVEKMFNLNRGEIGKEVVKWREEVGGKLIGQYILDCDDAVQVNTILTIKGSTDATKHLFPGTRFLLRADTVFALKEELLASNDRDKEHGRLTFSYHFPTIVASTQAPDSEHALDQYARNTGVERIAKALLQDIGMPDAAYAEMNMGGNKFACGRCRDLPYGSWEDLITHYHTRLRRWVGGKFIKDEFVTRHPILFLNQHCLQTGPDTQPLARILRSDDPAAMGEPTGPSEADWRWCLICSGIDHPLLREGYPCMEYLQEHLRESHGITQRLMYGVHYTSHGEAAYLQPRRVDEWQKEWDAYYDAQVESSPLENTCEPGPSL